MSDSGGFDSSNFDHGGFDGCYGEGGIFSSSKDTAKFQWCDRCESNYQLQLKCCPRCSDLSDDQVRSLIAKEQNSLDKMATRMLYGIGAVVVLLCVVFCCF